MTRSLLTQRRLLVVVVALLLISSMLPTAVSTRIAYIPHAVVALVISPFTAPLKSLADSLRPGETLSMGVGSPDEAQVRLGQALVIINQLEQELETAHQQISLLTQTDAIALEGTRRIMARVASFSGDRLAPVIRIDRGSLKGIREGAPVVHGVNLVGLVETVYPTSADVELITAAGTKFQVRIRPPEVDATPREVSEMIELSDDGSHFEIAKLTKSTPIQVGDWAHLADSRWPHEAQGWVIGKVTQIRDSPENPLMFKQVIIHPMEPLSSMSRVTVVVPVEGSH